MLTETMLQRIRHQAASEKWSYPQLFEAFKEAGVEFYEVEVATNAIVYEGQGTSIRIDPSGIRRLRIATNFDPQGVARAIEENQERKTDYFQFLTAIAASGVERYRVDMATRRIEYRSSSGQIHTESVPANK